MTCYWDTSALLALLFKEPATKSVRLLASKERGLPGYTSFFSFIEMESAYSRRMMEGSLLSKELSRLRLQAQKLEGALAMLWPEREVLSLGRRLAFEFGLKPGDALQLASSQLLAQNQSPVIFVSLDDKLNEAAQAVGLSTSW